MEGLVEFLSAHATHAHWFILLGLLLAGCNIPISIDVLVIIAAILSTHFVPEHTYILYFTLLGGCWLSAWIAYFLGRTIGPKLKNQKAFQFILSDKKITSMGLFYKKYGAWAFLIGRFIPFGVRNCLFMTTGLTKMSFLRFILLDLGACFLWVTSFFYLFLTLGENFETLRNQAKVINVSIFIVFALAVIGLIWYKRAKQRKNNLPI
jgi:membrane-associated protein